MKLPQWIHLCVAFIAVAIHSAISCSTAIAQPAGISSPNILFILCDDHRFDCLGSAGHPFLETPHLDSMAKDGVTLTRTYVTTSLCSPSRASILTGQYAHNHRVIDNYHEVDPTLTFFPQVLQSAGYQTAFIGKWHMGGDIDDPQRGFDHWISFKGQGTYWPDGHGTTREVPQTTYDGFNINGRRVAQEGYITDELTDYALQWLQERDPGKPFFMYVSHKAVHADFVPADRHRGRYDEQPLPVSEPTAADMEQGNLPMWVRNQRNSRHGSDFGYNLADFDPAVYYRRYCESLLAVDDSVGRMRAFLQANNLADNTIVVYMGDNGFQFGDHGLIDKRTAYEASAKVPLLIVAPNHLAAGQTFDGLVGNIDIAPTLLEAAGQRPTSPVDGISVWDALKSGDSSTLDGRTILYEYYWERNYPHTPTLHAIIGGRFKYIRCHGLWDRDELYDLESDPDEMSNLIDLPEHADRIRELNAQLWDAMQSSDGMEVPLLEDRGPRFPWRHPDHAGQASYPAEYFRTSEPDPPLR
ncbi:MAG: sulfatase [Planctomycetota bacterium]